MLELLGAVGPHAARYIVHTSSPGGRGPSCQLKLFGSFGVRQVDHSVE